MKITLNVFLAVVLFCSATLAGDMGSGGYQGCPENCPPPPCTENCNGPDGQTVTGFGAAETDLVLFAVGQYLGISL